MSTAKPAVSRETILGGAIAAGLVVLTLAVLPVGSILQGIFPALAAGLTTAALVLIYRTIRIINWAQIALGGVSSMLFYELYTRDIVPFPIALIAGIAAGALIGVLLGLIASTLFFRHPRLVMTVVTINMIGLIVYVQQQIQAAFTEEGEIRPIFPVPLPEDTFWNTILFEVSLVPFRVAHVLFFVLLAGTSIGLAIFFRRSRIGTAIRASAENADRASLLGINVKALQIGVWTLVGFISGIAGIAVLPIEQYSPASAANFGLLLLPLTAAVLARMTSMPLGFAAGVALIYLERVLNELTRETVWFEVALVGMLLGSLIFQRKRIQSRVEEAISWKATKEVRPTPRELLALKAISRTRIGLIAFGGLLVLGIPWITGLSTVSGLTQMWLFAMIGTSLVILTGWTGQISLGQMAIAMVGAYVGGNLTGRMSVPFLVAVLLAGVVGALFAVVIGLPALRIRGLFLAATTFAIGSILPFFFFEERFLGKWLPNGLVRPPKLFFLDFQDQRSRYYLVLGAFVLVVLAVQGLRKSRGGRVLIGLRDNEAAVQAFGIDIVRTRLMAFALSGFIAAFAGAIMVHVNFGMNTVEYTGFMSIQVFIMVVIGGVSSVAGAALGSLFFIGGGLLIPGLIAILTSVSGLIVLMAIPGGLTQVVFGLRDGILRVVAMRQHIVVPSLFADYSPEAWEKRLAPLSPPLQTQGLAVLRPDQRYAMPSRVFGGAQS